MKTLRKKWLGLSGLGLALVGMGVAFALEAAHLKHQGADTLEWVLAGTGALMVLNTGLSIFGEAVVTRVRYLQKNDQDY